MVNKNFFYNAIKQDITIIRGDTMSFNFQLQGLGGQDPDDIVLEAKEDFNDTEHIFICSVSNGISKVSYDEETDTATYTVRLSPEQTKELLLADYYYNLQIRVNGDVLTLLKGKLTLEYNVTKGV